MVVPIVHVDNVSKRFVIRKDNSVKERLLNFRRGVQHREEFWALRNIDLEIDAGSTIGLIGPNGSGKSTLLKTIGGIIQPTSGVVRRRGQMAALLELGAGFHPDLTGRENVYLNAAILGLSRRQTDSHFDEIVEFSGIGEFIDTQVKFYSSGMYVRLAFAVAIHVDPDLLLVDEVLAVGDEAFQRKCLDKIRAFQQEGRTIVLVSHTLSQITELCTRSLVLARGSVVYDGDPEDAVSVLRSGFSSDGSPKPEEPAPPKEHARIKAIRVLNSNGDENSRFDTGDDVVIEVDVVGETVVPSWGLGLHIDNPFGQLVFGTTTGALGADPKSSLSSQATGRFVLKNAPLGPGDYGITIALVGEGRVELDRAKHTSGFSVEKTGNAWGPVSADATFSVR